MCDKITYCWNASGVLHNDGNLVFYIDYTSTKKCDIEEFRLFGEEAKKHNKDRFEGKTGILREFDIAEIKKLEKEGKCKCVYRDSIITRSGT